MIYFIVFIIFLAILVVVFRKDIKKVWLKLPGGLEGGVETHPRHEPATAPSAGDGIIAEWREPDWFKFAGGSYSNNIPNTIEVWLQVYFRNTGNDPFTLQSARVDFSREGRFWQGYSAGPELTFGGNITTSLLPKNIAPKDSLILYFPYRFPIAAASAEDFVAQVKIAPDLIFKIQYQTKEGVDTRDKVIERTLNFKEEYPKVYKMFLMGRPQAEAQQIARMFD
jgi:hypothetical protein